MTIAADSASEFQAKGEASDAFASLASAWADLLHVEMAIFHLEPLPPISSNIFVRRALWEDAVVTYGRCFNTGRRSSVVGKLESLVAELPEPLQAAHKEVIRWRNKHVAHRVDEQYEQTHVVVRASDTPSASTVLRARAYVVVRLSATPQLIAAVGQLAMSLKNRMWERYLKAGEAAVIASFDQSCLRVAQSPTAQGNQEVMLTIDPSGAISGGAFRN